MITINGKFKSQKITGVQRVAHELVKELSKSKEIRVIDNPFSGIAGHLYEQLILPFKLKNNEVLISPINLGPIFVKNQIVVIHDVATFDHPEWFSKGFSLFYKIIIPILVKRAKAIVTVSEFSKRRIIELFDADESKIHVVLNGVDFKFFTTITKNETNTLSQFNLSKGKYYLSVCSLDPRKNLSKLITAWLQTDLPMQGYKLAFVGGSGVNFSKTEKFTHSSIVWLGYVEDLQLPTIYQNAAAFAYVSLYEGFGLPPLEAMCTGIPVLASNTTSLPEVDGDCGVLVNPESETAIAKGLLDVLNLKPHIIEKAKQRSMKFTWEKVAENFTNIINNLQG
jgi:glycosyltransferase involved in cell wall biosynthesis